MENQRVLHKIRTDILHTTDSAWVLKKINTKFKQLLLPLENGNDDAINVLKDIARIHGLPISFRECLNNLMMSSDNDLHGEAFSDSFIYKVSLIIKYAVKQNHDFIPLKSIITILLKRYPLDINYTDHVATVNTNRKLGDLSTNWGIGLAVSTIKPE